MKFQKHVLDIGFGMGTLFYKRKALSFEFKCPRVHLSKTESIEGCPIIQYSTLKYQTDGIIPEKAREDSIVPEF